MIIQGHVKVVAQKCIESRMLCVARMRCHSTVQHLELEARGHILAKRAGPSCRTGVTATERAQQLSGNEASNSETISSNYYFTSHNNRTEPFGHITCSSFAFVFQSFDSAVALSVPSAP